MKKLFIVAAVLTFPFISFAQELDRVKTLIESIGEIINTAIPIVFALALLVFFWGLVKYIFGGAEDKDKAKNLMIWGVVALFVMATVWGLVQFIGDAVGIEDGAAPDVGNLIPTA